MKDSTRTYLLLACLPVVALPVIGVFNSGPDFALFKDSESYASAHSIMVALSFALCALIFGTGWYTAIGDRSGVMAFLSAAFFAVGLLTLGQLLSLGGMPRFAGRDNAIAFALAARYAGAMTLLTISLAPARIRITTEQRYVLLGGGLVYVALIYWVILARPDLLPRMEVAGRGLTPFKIWGEYGATALFGLTVAILVIRRTGSPLFSVARLLAAVIVLSASEIAFALNRMSYDDYSVAGYVYKFIAFVLIYRVVFAEAVTEPHRLRAASEAALHRNEEHLSRAQRIGHIGSVELDFATGRVTWSDEMFAILGLDPSTTAQAFESHLAVTHPDDRAKLIELRDRDHLGDATGPSELRIIRPDGQVRSTLRRSELIRAPDGTKHSLIITFEDFTDRKNIADALRESEQLLREAAGAAQIGIFHHDHRTDAIYWSPEQRRIFGVGPDEPITFELYLSFLHPDDRSRVMAAIDRAHDPAGDGRFDIEYRIVRRDGEVRWLKSRVGNIFDGQGPDGRVVRASGAVFDISDTKEFEERLRRSEAHLAQAQSVGGIGSSEYDLVRGKYHRSDEYFRLLGIDRAATRPDDEPLLNRIIPEDRGNVLTIDALVSHSGPIPPIAYRLRRGDGEIRWLQTHTTIIAGSDGAPVSIFFVHRDITDARRAEDRLRQSEKAQREQFAQMLAMIEQAPTMIAMFDRDMNYVVASKMWKAEYAGNRDDVAGLNHYQLLGDFPEKWRAVNKRALAGETVRNNDDRWVRPDGGVRWLRSVVQPWTDAEGKIGGVIITDDDYTDRKTAEEALRESEERFATVFRDGPIGTAIIDMTDDRNIVDVNRAWSKIYGYRRDEAIGKNGRDLLFWPDPAVREATYQAISAAGTIWRGDVRLRRKDGKLIDIDLTMLRTTIGGKPCTIVLSSDVTDRKLAEAALLRSQTHLARAQSVGHIGSSEVDLLRNETHWTDEYCYLLGIDPTTAKPGSSLISSVVLPEDRGKIEPISNLAQQTRPIPPIEFRVRHADGKIHWLQRHAARILNAEGIPASLVFTLIDITEFKETEERLRRSETHLAQAQSVGLIGSTEYDLTNGVFRRSDTYLHLLGLDNVDSGPLDKHFANAIVPEDRDKLIPLPVLASYKGPIPPLTFRIQRPDGEIRWLHRHAAVISDANGKPVSIVFAAQDITDLKRAEEQSLALERQLVQAQKMEAVGQLTGGVAHDFNNLLAVVLGRLHMLAEELSADPKLEEWTQICIRAAERGASLTRNLLAFSRMQPLNPSNVELNDIVADMTELLRRALGETINIRLITTPQLWPCLVDSGQVQNALLNLAVNARDAMPDGGQLTVETNNVQLDADYVVRHPDVRPGDYVLLSVSDTGTGIAADTLERVFEPFFTTKDMGHGSGLGLSMVYGFAKQSGGHVSIYSEVGQGTTVKLYLPRARGSMEIESAAAHAPSIQRGHETLLVVEDSDDLRDLTRLQLERLGYRVIAAGDSIEGLRLLRQHPETVLLLSDIVLGGGVSGPQLAESAVGINPGIAVVFMTGYSGQTALEATGKFGAECILSKPFTREELARQVRVAIDRSTS